MKHGLKLKNLHRGYRFEQSYLKNLYIMSNSKLRKTALKEVQKLMNGSAFGKTIVNIKSRKDMKLVTSQKSMASMWKSQTLKMGNYLWKSYLLQRRENRDQDKKTGCLCLFVLDWTRHQCMSFEHNFQNI